jgi:hypothetical protein
VVQSYWYITGGSTPDTTCVLYVSSIPANTAVWEFDDVHILLQTFACKGGTNKGTCNVHVGSISMSIITYQHNNDKDELTAATAGYCMRIHRVHRYFLKRKTIFGISSNLQMDANSDTCMMLVLSIYTCRTLQYETTTTVAAREFVVHFL